MRHEAFPAQFFKDNRRNLALRLDDDSMAMLFAAEPMVRNGDQHHPWRQDSNFFYLTGLEQPGMVLLVFPEKNGVHQEVLFIPPVDPLKEKWEGKLLRVEEAQKLSGIKQVLTIDLFLPQFYRMQDKKNQLFTEVNSIFPDQPLTKAHQLLADFRMRLPGLMIRKLAPLLLPFRSKKQPIEIDRIRHSLEIINTGLRSAASKIKAEVMEYQIEAELAYQYLYHGCSRVGFDTIVAGGQNACTLHYIENSAALKDGDLVLIDTGGEYGLYSGDITRVFPVSGKFTKRQAHCYNAVLEVNQQMIRQVRAHLSWKEILEISARVQGEVYKKYGFIKDVKDYLKVGYHRIGHNLGLDVHDVQNLEWPLKAGAVITIEPGIYLPDEGIGIRIEDDVLLLEGGNEVLSKEIPKTIKDIEALMAKK